ncbi:MAG: hypothetical protein PHO02_01175 [Candidatus Nanoarchaeia archaeon]|nr:hypothetical protein [Candidatus Nanoarchaeia archaeon]
MTKKEVEQIISKYEKEIRKLDRKLAESNKRFDYHFNRIMQML